MLTDKHELQIQQQIVKHYRLCDDDVEIIDISTAPSDMLPDSRETLLEVTWRSELAEIAETTYFRFKPYDLRLAPILYTEEDEE